MPPTVFSTSRMADLLEAESPRLPWGATLVVVTGILSDALLATLVRLKTAGRKTALIAVGADVDPEQLPGIRVYRTPVEAQTETAWVMEPTEVLA